MKGDLRKNSRYELAARSGSPPVRLLQLMQIPEANPSQELTSLILPTLLKLSQTSFSHMGWTCSRAIDEAWMLEACRDESAQKLSKEGEFSGARTYRLSVKLRPDKVLTLPVLVQAEGTNLIRCSLHRPCLVMLFPPAADLPPHLASFR